MRVKFYLRFIHFILAMGLLALVFYLLISDINPSGIREVEHRPQKEHSLVKGPYPPERLLGVFAEGSNTFWEILVDPVYFDLHLPRLYQQIEMIIEYQTVGQDIVNLGGVGGANWNVSLHPGQNKIIDNLDWPYTELGRVRIYQNLERLDRLEPIRYISLFDFISRERDRSILTYFFGFSSSEISAQRWEEGVQLSDFDFLVTTYRSPKILPDGWQQIRATFSPAELRLQNRKYQFLVSAPLMDKNRDRLRIRQVKFVLYKEPITQDNYQVKLRRFWQRLKARIGL